MDNKDSKSTITKFVPNNELWRRRKERNASAELPVSEQLTSAHKIRKDEEVKEAEQASLTSKPFKGVPVNTPGIDNTNFNAGAKAVKPISNTVGLDKPAIPQNTVSGQPINKFGEFLLREPW